MEKVLRLYKPLGQTPLQSLRQFQAEHPEYAHVKLGYAGRLDPMAEGLLLVMVGDENKNRAEYLGLDKEYEVEVLLGISTDSFDLLGIPQVALSEPPNLTWDQIDTTLQSLTGTFEMVYPPYSSKTIQGKPLYAWTKQGKLSEITLPTAMRTIHSIELLRDHWIDSGEIDLPLYDAIPYLREGDFRIDEIMQAWKAFMTDTQQEAFRIITIRVLCSSGTYMRSLAEIIGKAFHTSALAYSIKRTRVGDYALQSAEAVAHD